MGEIARVETGRRETKIRVKREGGEDFAAFLIDQIPSLFLRFTAEKELVKASEDQPRSHSSKE